MDRISKLVENSQSGPDLYMNMGDETITIGTLNCLLGEIYNAAQGALMAVQQLEDRFCMADPEDCALFLMAKLTLEYAMDCHTSLIVSRDANGLQIYADQSDPDKITYINPTEIAKAGYRKEKAKKEERDHGQAK